MFFAETIVRNPGATFEMRAAAGLVDSILVVAAAVLIGFVLPGGPHFAFAQIPDASALTSRYGIDLFGVARINLETFATAGDPAPAYGPGASVLSWGRDEIVVSLAGAILMMAAGFAYWTGFEGRFNATPGKMLLGMRVRDEVNAPAGWSLAIKRNLFKLGLLGVLVAGFALGDVVGAAGGIAASVAAGVLQFAAFAVAAMGALVAAFSYRNRAAYDMLAGTRVIVPGR